MTSYKAAPGRNRIVAALWRRKLLFVSVFLLVVISGMFTTFLITPKYEATMSILISKERTDPTINPSDRSPELVQAGISDEEFNSELELVKSIEVVTSAVKDLDLPNDRLPKNDTWLTSMRGRIKTSVYNFTKSVMAGIDPPKPNSPAETANQAFEIEKTVNQVVSNLEVVPTKKSRIIKVTYTDTDPVRAKKTLEKIYEKYVDLHVRMSEDREADQVFKDQSEKFGEKLSSTTNELKAFDIKNGVTGQEIATQRGLLLKQLYDTQAQVNATTSEISETEQRVATLKSQIATMPEQIEVSSVSRYVSALDRMKEELVRLEQQRTDLMQKYKKDSRFVRENEERIQQLRRNIATETANPPQEKSYALNDLRRRLEGELNAAQTTLSGLKKRASTLSGQAEKLNSEVVALNSRSIERDSLERSRTINEEAYLLYQKKVRENEISQVLNKERVLNFAMVDPPRTDGEQKNPKPLLNLLVLSLVGLFGGFAAALVTSPRPPAVEVEAEVFITALDFERRYGLPVLASVPLIDAARPAKRLSLEPGEYV